MYFALYLAAICGVPLALCWIFDDGDDDRRN